MHPVATTLLAAAIGLSANAASAQTYPAKPVRIIIPFPPGGPTDIFGRMIAQHLSEALKQQFIADNRPGAGGNIGVEQAAKAPPDGYTLTCFTVAQAIAPGIYKKLSFDPRKDLAHISLVALVPSVLMVHPALPAKNVKDLIAVAKARPNELTYASTGNGTSPHMLMEMFKWMTGTQMVHVPYKGAAPALLDQIAGQVVVAFNSAVGALPHARSGKLRALAVSTEKRFAAMPDLPTVEEAGVKGYAGSSWQGFAAPAGTPPEILNRIQAEIAIMLQKPELRERIVNVLGGIPIGSTPAEFSKYVAEEVVKWEKVSKAANITLN
ncbi:MAG: tripartite tricarboxylate transporter substrate binding protein [Burkholderiales bacterium]|nr:tripartite tricarboxylate transporter substrate binding protein [Burkholderiales bacterium]